MKKLASILILILFSFICIYPIGYVLGVSLRGDNAFSSRSLAIIPAEATFKNFYNLFSSTPFLKWSFNSLVVSLSVTALGVILSACAGYALSRYKVPGRSLVLKSVLTTQMFPATMLMLPFFVMLSKLGLINSFLGLIIIYSSTALPFCLWQMKGYFDTIPFELEEAAQMDGLSPFLIFWRIILPLSLPALAITSLFSFMASWSEYTVAAIILQDPELYTLPLGLKSFQSSLATEWGLYAAASLIVSIPVVIIFISFSKYLIGGLTVGGVK